jgi:regulator of cell morphogenesis and NO signaling
MHVTTAEKTIAEMVTEDYRTADVFKKFGIDFCCGGKVTVEEICKKKNINYTSLSDQLNQVGQLKENTDSNYNDWQLDKLANYILEKHHGYVSENLELIRQYADKVALVHGQHRPEVKKISELYNEAAEELAMHMQKEEMVLFPYVNLLAAAKRSKVAIKTPHFGTVENPITMMESEHEAVGNLFHEIARLSDNYSAPPEACNTYRVLYAKLKEFEDDLHTHIHLENNILFPKATLLEKELMEML